MKPTVFRRFEFKTDDGLHPCCVSYWGMLATFSTVHQFPLTPDRFVELVFTPDKLECKYQGHWRIMPRVFVVGRLEKCILLRIGGQCRFLSVRLLGATAAMVLGSFGLCAKGLSDATGVFPYLERVILEGLRSQELKKMKQLLDEHLSRQRAHWNPLLPPIRTVMKLTLEQPFDTQAEKAVTRPLSRRQIERHVQQASGTNARTLRGLARFQRARDLMWEQRGLSMAGLAAEAGYSDQAHFNREFKKFTDLTPATFRRLLRQTERRP